MAPKVKQGKKSRAGHTTNGSNRQCLDFEPPPYEPNKPTDVHGNPVNFLTEQEVKRLVGAAKHSRNPERDTLLITMLFLHGLRENEALMIRRNWLKLDIAQVWIERLKGGRSSYHPLTGTELRLIRKYLRARKDDLPWLFISERMQPLSDRTVRVIVAKAAKKAGLEEWVTPHTLRHSCGFYLNDQGRSLRLMQDYLGHANPSSTMIYTRTAARQFEGLFK